MVWGAGGGWCDLVLRASHQKNKRGMQILIFVNCFKFGPDFEKARGGARKENQDVVGVRMLLFSRGCKNFDREA